MRRKGQLLGFLFTMSMCIGACAQPEEELLLEDQGITVALESAELESAKSENVTSDNGRHIQESYGEGDYKFKLDAQVYVSSQPVQTGGLSTRNIDIELVEKYLCDGEKLIKGSGAYEYISSGNSLDNDLDYDINIHNIFDSPGSVSYSNWRLDQYYSGSDFQMKSLAQWDSGDKAFIESMADRAEELFVNLGIENRYSNAILYKGIEGSGAEDNCYIETVSMLDGFPLVTLSTGDYMRNTCHIGERGVNGMQLGGIFRKNDEKSVAVIALDDVLAIVKDGVEAKNINTYDEAIQQIELAYMVNFVNQQPSFYPVWCFSTKLQAMDAAVPVLCINAQTGSVDYMSR